MLEQLGPPNEVEIIGIVVNEKGAERAIATKTVSTLGYPCSISETFLRRNQNQSPDENEAVLKRIKAMADEAGLGMVVYISMAFGNPYGDPWNEEKVADAAREDQRSRHSLNFAGGYCRSGGPGTDSTRRRDSRCTTTLRCELGVHLHSTRARRGGKSSGGL